MSVFYPRKIINPMQSRTPLAAYLHACPVLCEPFRRFVVVVVTRFWMSNSPITPAMAWQRRQQIASPPLIILCTEKSPVFKHCSLEGTHNIARNRKMSSYMYLIRLDGAHQTATGCSRTISSAQQQSIHSSGNGLRCCICMHACTAHASVIVFPLPFSYSTVMVICARCGGF